MIDRELLKKAGVAANEIEQLEQAWNAFQAVATKTVSETPSIVCTGIYNAGKSTLLNALAGEDIFPTGDVPTTKVAAQAEFGGAIYIDTPGLNAEEEDDQETLAAYASADFILFVSNAQNGGVTASEAEWLQKLAAKYTAESLKQRLIYVLSHSAQVDIEELSSIEEHVRSDLEKALGFLPDQFFCVDSIVYQDGRAQDQTLLVESSGIPQLQYHLAEQVAGAEDALRQAHEAGLNVRRAELSQALETVRAEAQRVYDAQSRQTQEQIAVIDAAWEEFEEILTKSMPSGTINPISCFISLPSCSINVKERSEYAAQKKLEERLRRVYDKREQIVRDEVRKIIEHIRTRYCYTGLDSVYSAYCSKMTQVFNNYVLKFQRFGVSTSVIETISVMPELPAGLSNEIERDLLDNVVQYGGYYSLPKYVEMYGEIACYTEYERGLLGIQREVDMYHVSSTWSIIREMEKDIKSSLDSNVSYANGKLNSYWHGFLKKLTPEITRHRSELKFQVDAYKESLSNAAGLSPTEHALSHVDALREVAGL